MGHWGDEMRHNGFATPEQLAILTEALKELGGHLPLDSPERDTLAAEIMMLFESGVETLEELKAALSSHKNSPRV
ncbi:hypothetical protein [Mesorhizobium sp. WSM3860]|uniref:hypothetical protein n=1 Tax=Mesorhizobium sp. WSM3860 TaxID=2029403 RepID=UPI000BB0A291|nr:hypothetical protein [Mesorhizobium sp. WSM3860]PBC04627.1 hypothetical protein CK220_10540 [Mesorhizobium sp. WSM3860]